MTPTAINFRLPRFHLTLLACIHLRQKDLRLTLLLQLLTVLLAIPGDSSLVCQCDPQNCPETNCTEADIDPCTCCPICVTVNKGVGERCGGLSNAEGSCDSDLICALRPGSVFGEDRAGVCESASCKNLKCGFRQRCVHTHPAMPMKCGCPQFKCADKLNPVCGHDNVEYISICRLQEQECKSGKFIGVKNYSGCGHEEETADPIDINTLVAVPINGGCVHMNNWYTIGQRVETREENPCQVMYCVAHNTLKVVSFPGCGTNPPEEDYGVDKPPVHGGWSQWSPWSQCIGSCGSAFRSRERNCSNPVPMNEGRACEGASMEEEECTPKSCEENATCAKYFSGWSYWSPCSASCGQGTRQRVRNHLRSIISLNVDERRRVFALCPDTQSESCKISNCNNENCTRSFVHDYIWKKHPDYLLPVISRIEHNCRSIQKHSFMVCGGMCNSNSVSMETSCCQPSSTHTKSVTFQCHPDIRRQREISVVLPHACTCAPCNA